MHSWLQRVVFGAALLTSPLALAQGFREARPWLGVAIEKGPAGVTVKDVLSGTPAKDAGLVAGDEITAIDDKAVHAPEELIATVAAQGVGNTVTVHYLHGGKPTEKKVKLVARPDELELLRAQLVASPRRPSTCRSWPATRPASRPR